MATAASGMEDSVRWVVDRLLVLNTTIRMTEFLTHHFDEIHVIAICLALAYFATGLGILQKVFRPARPVFPSLKNQTRIT